MQNGNKPSLFNPADLISQNATTRTTHNPSIMLLLMEEPVMINQTTIILANTGNQQPYK
jgi:hypothetical protein